MTNYPRWFFSFFSFLLFFPPFFSLSEMTNWPLCHLPFRQFFTRWLPKSCLLVASRLLGNGQVDRQAASSSFSILQ